MYSLRSELLVSEMDVSRTKIRLDTSIFATSKAGHSGSNISSIMHLGLANMLMWQAIKEERDGYSNIGRYRNIINVMLLCVMHGNKWDHL